MSYTLKANVGCPSGRVKTTLARQITKKKRIRGYPGIARVLPARV